MQPEQPFRVVIPARFQSTRFPGKPLAEICGKSMLLHVYENALQSSAEEVLIATDDERIFNHVSLAGANVCMTSSEHETGTDRLVEVVRQRNWMPETIVVNVQGDEPLLPVSCIEQVAVNLHHHTNAVMATLATPIANAEDVNDQNVVKVVSNADGMAMLFSRSAIPCYRDTGKAQFSLSNRHLGIYAYRAGFLSRYAELPFCALEQAEKLEQLRVLFNGDQIHVDTAKEIPGPGVDTPEQLAEVEVILAQQAQS